MPSQQTLPSYHQYVTCKTCNNHPIDLCYGNISKAYRSSPLPSLGRSLYNMVHLLPAHRQRLKTGKPLSRQVKRWTIEATDALNACFDCADWDVFFDAESSLVEVVDRVTSYVNFCIDVLVPVKEVKIHPNNKPWITRDIATVLMQRKQALREGNMEEDEESAKKC